jgi:hypothetical protein
MVRAWSSSERDAGVEYTHVEVRTRVPGGACSSLDGHAGTASCTDSSGLGREDAGCLSLRHHPGSFEILLKGEEKVWNENVPRYRSSMLDCALYLRGSPC